MNGLDIILLILIAAVLGLALRRVLRVRRNRACCGGRCGDCPGCGKQGTA